MQRSLADFAAIKCQAALHSSSQRRHQFIFAFVAHRDLNNAPLEDLQGVSLLLSLSQHLLCPCPDVLLRVQVWRVSWPWRNQTHTTLFQRSFRFCCVHDAFTIEQESVRGTMGEHFSKEGLHSILQHLDEVSRRWVERTWHHQTPPIRGGQTEHLRLGALLVLTALKDVVLWLQKCAFGFLLFAHDSFGATLDLVAFLELLREESEEPEIADSLDATAPHGPCPTFMAGAKFHTLLSPGCALVVTSQFIIHGVPFFTKTVADRAKAHFVAQGSWQCTPDISRLHKLAEWLGEGNLHRWSK